ncbi:hypothetical protein J6590_008288 [Homalodisca vitripennis]|nr:hypothetical protein J6590_008288 [Homalodisca vitripennis]
MATLAPPGREPRGGRDPHDTTIIWRCGSVPPILVHTTAPSDTDHILLHLATVRTKYILAEMVSVEELTIINHRQSSTYYVAVSILVALFVAVANSTLENRQYMMDNGSRQH